jgi:hypothetical protein
MEPRNVDAMDVLHVVVDLARSKRVSHSSAQQQQCSMWREASSRSKQWALDVSAVAAVEAVEVEAESSVTLEVTTARAVAGGDVVMR